MKLKLSLISLVLPCISGAANILSPADQIIAIDRDPPASSSGYPGGENPTLAIDGNNGTKYLNFGGAGSGFIVTPSASSVIQSFNMVTGNDSPDRDPTSYELFGTNGAIVSTDNSGGLGEIWTSISNGALSLPGGRNTLSTAVNITNTTAYSSYKMIFPTVGGSTLMQFSEVQFFAGANATGGSILGTGNSILAVDTLAPTSNYPSNEAPSFILDGNNGTKYLNFGENNSGFIVKPAAGATTIGALEIITANDSEERDPSSYEIYGGNGAIGTTDNGFGDQETWTLISAGALSLPGARETSSGEIAFANSTAYERYKVIFPTVKDSASANSMQIAEFRLHAVPEPGSALLAGVAGLFLARRRRA